MDINVQSVHFTADEKLVEQTTSKLEKLAKLNDHIIAVEVYLKLEEESSHIKDKSAQIKVLIPHHTFFAKEQSKMFEEAVDLAIDNMKRQLRRYKEKVKG